MDDEKLREIWKLDKDAPLQISLAEEIRLAIHFAKERQDVAVVGFWQGVVAGVFALAGGQSLFQSGGWSGWIAAVLGGVAAWWLWRNVSTREEELLAILRNRLREAKE